MSMFRVGQRVYCVDAIPSFDWHRIDVNWPVVGCVYTIRGIMISIRGNACLLLEEVINERRVCLEGFVEPAFSGRRFRPVKDTSIEVFRALLTPIHER